MQGPNVANPTTPTISGTTINFAAGGTPVSVQGNAPTTATLMGVLQLDASGNAVGNIVTGSNSDANLAADVTPQPLGMLKVATDVPEIVAYTGVGGSPLLGTTYNRFSPYKTAVQVNTGTATTATIPSAVDIVQITAGAAASLAITIANGTTLGQEIQVELISSALTAGAYTVAGVQLGTFAGTPGYPTTALIPGTNPPIVALFKWNGSTWSINQGGIRPAQNSEFGRSFGTVGFAQGKASTSFGGQAYGVQSVAFTGASYGDYSSASGSASARAYGNYSQANGAIAHGAGAVQSGTFLPNLQSNSAFALNNGNAFGARSFVQGNYAIGSSSYPATSGVSVSNAVTALTLTGFTVAGNVTPAGGGYYEPGALFILQDSATSKSYLCQVTTATFTTSTAVVYTFVDLAPLSIAATGTVFAASPGAWSTVMGQASLMLNMSGFARAGTFNVQNGDSQIEEYHLMSPVIAAGATGTFTLDGLAVNTNKVFGNSDRLITEKNKAYSFLATVIGKQTASSTYCQFTRRISFANNNGTIGTITIGTATSADDVIPAGWTGWTVGTKFTATANATYSSVDFAITNNVTGGGNTLWTMHLIGPVALLA